MRSCLLKVLNCPELKYTLRKTKIPALTRDLRIDVSHTRFNVAIQRGLGSLLHLHFYLPVSTRSNLCRLRNKAPNEPFFASLSNNFLQAEYVHLDRSTLQQYRMCALNVV